jgi:hypothetical protein
MSGEPIGGHPDDDVVGTLQDDVLAVINQTESPTERGLLQVSLAIAALAVVIREAAEKLAKKKGSVE